ncbi:MAG: nitroreductase family protein [Candidatus Lokiarchaeota archaeon]|nr:nitroreductase family protein [Candidatus Lokiarchaeota archaeon]
MDTENNLIELIKSRKSIRNFIYEKISNDTIKEILECGRWAPSASNRQPWKVCVVIHPTVKRMLAEVSKYGGIIESAYVNFVIFLDVEKGGERVKDVQSIGAFIQNILLGVESKGLGAVWIGEILKNKDQVNEIFKLPMEKFDLMGVIAMGVIDEPMVSQKSKERERYPLEEFIEFY